MAIRRFYLSGVLVVLALILAACRPDEEELSQEGEELYLANCARCRQVGGRGFADVFPALDGNPVVTLHDPVPVIQVVIHGRGAMPGFVDVPEDREEERWDQARLCLHIWLEGLCLILLGERIQIVRRFCQAFGHCPGCNLGA